MSEQDELEMRELSEELGEPVRDAVDDELADDELVALFSSFDDVRASDELKAATLAMIFGETDNEVADQADVDQADAIEADVDEADAEDAESNNTAPAFELLEGGLADAAMHAEDVRAQADLAQHAQGRKHRTRGWWLRVAAAVLVVTLATGGVAYAVPATHVVVSQDNMTVDLGINVFGQTVSVTASDDELQAIVDREGVRGENFEAAFNHVLFACEERLGTGDDANTNPATVEMRGLFVGEGSPMAQSIDRMMDEHAWGREMPAPVDGGAQANDAAPAHGEDAPTNEAMPADGGEVANGGVPTGGDAATNEGAPTGGGMPVDGGVTARSEASADGDALVGQGTTEHGGEPQANGEGLGNTAQGGAPDGGMPGGGASSAQGAVG